MDDVTAVSLTTPGPCQSSINLCGWLALPRNMGRYSRRCVCCLRIDYEYTCATAHMWWLKDNLKCQHLPSTLFEIRCLVCFCGQPSLQASIRGLLALSLIS